VLSGPANLVCRAGVSRYQQWAAQVVQDELSVIAVPFRFIVQESRNKHIGIDHYGVPRDVKHGLGN
jgi:hypothetical protein